MAVEADCTFVTSLYCLFDLSSTIRARSLQHKEHNYEFLSPKNYTGVDAF